MQLPNCIPCSRNTWYRGGGSRALQPLLDKRQAEMQTLHNRSAGCGQAISFAESVGVALLLPTCICLVACNLAEGCDPGVRGGRAALPAAADVPHPLRQGRECVFCEASGLLKALHGQVPRPKAQLSILRPPPSSCGPVGSLAGGAWVAPWSTRQRACPSQTHPAAEQGQAMLVGVFSDMRGPNTGPGQQ